MSIQSSDRTLDQIQSLIGNQLDASVHSTKWLAGIVGDYPSRYAKSPTLWNAAFKTLGLDGIFVPFDVESQNLPLLIESLRRCDHVVGFSVTVPYKVEVINLLDGVDEKARLVGAVNTVARTPDGRLIGCNTDGQGFVDMLVKPLPGSTQPFLEGLEDQRVVLLGAGGAAKAVAFSLGEILKKRGHLTIVNRNAAKSNELASSVADAYGCRADSLSETDLKVGIQQAGLVVNATTKGQSGVRKLPARRATCLEPYSALGPANPSELEDEAFATVSDFYRAWYGNSQADIETNFHTANEVVQAMTPDAAVVDLIYSPLETRTLAMARWNGHRSLNGREMNVRQAADAFVNHVMKPHLREMGWELSATHQRVCDIMSRIW